MADSSTPEILNTYARKLVQIKARQLCQRRGFSPSDCEDLEQDMLLHLLEQSHKFDPDRASLPTFISRVVDSHVAMILRGQRCKKRAAGIMALSLQPMLISAARRPEKQRSCLKNGELYHLSKATHTEMDTREFQEAVEALPADLQEIVNRLTEAPATKVARDLGISRRQMSYAINSIRRHLSIAGFSKKYDFGGHRNKKRHM